MPLVGPRSAAHWVALSGKLTDAGINGNFMHESAASLTLGPAGLFVLIRKMTTDTVLATLRGKDGTVACTLFDEPKERRCATRLASHAAAEKAAAPDA